MSVRSLAQTGVTTLPVKSITPASTWTRNPSWLTLTPVSDTEQAFRGLLAVYPDSTFTAFTASGAYTVNWGDGTTSDHATTSTALKQYDYTNVNLDNTNAPITFTDSGDLVSRTSHGYSDGMQVQFYNIQTTTGITEGQIYYVVNSTQNTFQISQSESGVPVTLVGDGSATLLPYKQAVVTITPQAGQNLTALNLNIKHTETGLQPYETGWLDMELGSPNFTTTGLVIASNSSGAENVRFTMCERVAVRNFGLVTELSHRFRSMRSLKAIIFGNTAAVKDMSSMFQNCVSLTDVPLFDTSAVTSMGSMFQGCVSLVNLPLFNTVNVVNISSMFNGCQSLASVPAFNTISVTSTAFLFANCSSLKSVPLLNTSSATSTTSMFQNCGALVSVPLFDTSIASTMNNMFVNCTSLTHVPLLNTSSATNMISMFNGCTSLQQVPALVVTAASSSGNLSNMFNNCNSLSRIQAKNFRFSFSVANCKLSATALNEIYTNLPIVSGQTITVLNNWGTVGDDPTIASAKGWTVTL